MSAPGPATTVNVSQSTTRFITAMKLRELRRQREKLRDAYRLLGESVGGADAPEVRLRRLYDGLRGVRFAGQSLHPDVVNLEILLREADAGAASDAVVALWRERLEAEARAGRLRSEFVYLFGALLEEWTREEGGEQGRREEAARAKEEMLATALSAPEPNRHRPLFDALFDEMEPGLSTQGERLRDEYRTQLDRIPGVVPEWRDDHPITDLLKRLAADPYHAPRIRREARHFNEVAQSFTDLADALRILASEWSVWDWPDDGFAARTLWARVRWRFYVDADLPTVCLLEWLGDQLVSVVDRKIAGSTTLQDQRARLIKLNEIHAPSNVLEHLQSLLQEAEQTSSLEGYEAHDLWQSGVEETATVGGHGSVLTQRKTFTRILKQTSQGGYEDEESEYESGMANPVVRLVHAEVQLARAAFPDRPLYVVKADLRDFYARIPHDALLTILERLGVTDADREFFARFLSPPLRADRDAPPVRMARGVPMNFTLSALLADLLLRLMERYVRQGARVRIVRQVDDICLLTPHADDAVSGWRRIGEFCAAVGLEVNAEKSGAICLGGTLPEGLPTEPPRWGMIALNDAGEWRVHRDTFTAYAERSRERVEGIPSLLGRVQAYNADAQYLLNALSLGAALGDTHRTEAFATVRDFHHAFFGPERGIAAGLRDEMRSRFPLDLGDGNALTDDIPDGWLYWPLTAGGLGLKNPLIIAGQFAEAYDSREKPVAPDTREPDWEHASNDWATFYRRLLEPLEVGEPEETRVMKALVQDFIARGAEITSGAQTDLSAYWKWVLYTYGPQILQRFGTFRFLITELVPLQLIRQQRVESSSQGGEGAGGDDVDEIPF